MKLGISAWSVQTKLFGKETDLITFIDFCKENGVDAVELLDCFFADKEEYVKVKKYLEDINMPIAAYSIGNDFVQCEKGVRQQIEYVKEGIDTAVFFGAKNLRIFSGSEKDGVSYETGLALIIECLKECAEYADEKGITMVLENHGLFAGKSSSIKSVIDSVNSPALRANADTGNFFLVGENPTDAVRNLKDYISFVHFKDMARVEENEHFVALDGLKYVGTVIGEGDVDLEAIVSILRDNGYEGFLSIEFEGVGEPYAGALQSIRNTQAVMRRCLAGNCTCG